eukprot:CAMPEP_0117613066 /NCGR_PEP_ID=MMETSP0784-20121206/83275_1 /TAXON_ID=39447 /ORGANISM="" /LENGTH=90 /DNA_ID=CAMNT_0005416645 /DNA_START=195 /DNA_END=467 /DNA_ORIENTATION=+
MPSNVVQSQASDNGIVQKPPQRHPKSEMNHSTRFAARMPTRAPAGRASCSDAPSALDRVMSVLYEIHAMFASPPSPSRAPRQGRQEVFED